MSEIDLEIDAIKTVLSALEPLSAAVRGSVLDYVTKRLQVSLPDAGPGVAIPGGPSPILATGDGSGLSPATEPIHIKKLKEDKRPRSANEMAALVAYFLANLANPKKGTVNAKDIESQFKIAGFPLSEHVKMTLPNAKNAGYFDLAGDGEYRLNAVGHNLVVHSMPRGSEKTPSSRSTRSARPSSRPRR